MTDAALAVEAASLTLGQFSLRNISLTLGAGEIMVLLGPNGAGKSVCLEMIAGFHRLTSGRIMIRGREVTHLPPEQRHVGLMFQNFGLFPHLTVAGNIALGFEARGRSRQARIRSATAELLAQFHITHLSGRYPQDLSPGEKQRTALARALAARPDLFLFDEPFAAIDARTRDALRGELKTFLRAVGSAAIFVSHDQTDAALLADHVVVLHQGEIQQAGTVSCIYRRPANGFVASFTGTENILPARRVESGGERWRIEGTGAVLQAQNGGLAGDEALLCVRAGDVGLCTTEAAPHDAMNRLAGQVTEATNLGAITRVAMDCGFPLIAYLTHHESRNLGLAPGLKIVAEIAPGAIHPLARGAAPSPALGGQIS